MKQTLLTVSTLLVLAACSSTSPVSPSSSSSPATSASGAPAGTASPAGGAYAGLALKVDGQAATVASTLQTTMTAGSYVFLVGLQTGLPVAVDAWTVTFGYSGGAQTTLGATFSHVLGTTASQVLTYTYELLKGADGKALVSLPAGATGDATVNGSKLDLHLTATIKPFSGDATPHAFDVTATGLPL